METAIYLKQLIESRYSVRAYLPKKVESEKINYILECARLAPSACNLQPWKFYVIVDESIKKKVQEAYNREWFKSAPVYIVVCKDTSQSWKRTNYDQKDFSEVDATIAAEHICLAASAVGLGTCWVCNFNPDILSSVINFPLHTEALAVFSLGYIDVEKSVIPDKKRKVLSEITEWI